MIEHIKKDFAPIWVMYGFSVISIVFVVLFAVPLAIRETGIFSEEAFRGSQISYDAQAFTNVSVRARSYIVYDVVSKQVIAEKDAYTPYTLASITKVMTALTAIHVAPLGTKIKVTKKSIDGGYDLGLKENQIWTLEDLLKYTLVFSSNDGAQIIADTLLGRKAFIAQMNEYAHELGFAMTFTHPAGLDEGGSLGGVGTAYDVARMMAFARTALADELDATTKTRLKVHASNGPISGIPNTNQSIDQFVGVEASKTGYTDNAGGNLALSVDVSLGHPVIIVVLGSTREARFSDAYALYLALIQSIR